MPRRCTRWWSGSASATATCRRAVSVATPTSRCGRWAKRSSARARDQEPEQLPLPAAGDRFEVRRQIELIEDGGRVVQETRLYDPDRDETRRCAARKTRWTIATSPTRTCCRWRSTASGSTGCAPDAGTARRDARALRARVRPAGVRRADADGVEGRWRSTSKRSPPRCADRKIAANWVMGEMAAALNERPDRRSRRRRSRRRSSPGSSAVCSTARSATRPPRRCSRRCGPARPTAPTRSSRRAACSQISDAGAIEKIVDEVLAANPKSVEEFRAGKEKAFNALVGQAMKATRGKANPQQVNEILRRRLAG